MKTAWYHTLAISAGVGLFMVTAACSTTHYARPVGKGNTAVELSLGGPFGQVFGKPVPLPLTTLGITHGVSDKLDVYGHLFPTMAAYQLVGVDVGASYLLRGQSGKIPAVVAGGALLFTTDISPQESPTGCNTCLMIDPHGVASWSLGPHLLYVGARGLLQTTPHMTEGTRRFMVAPLVGTELRTGDHLGITLEGRWEAPFVNTTNDVVTWYGLSNHGAWAALLGFNFHLNQPE